MLKSFAQSRSVKAIIFDMDGVLVDSERVWFQTTKEWLSGLIGKAWDMEEEARITGKSVPDIYRSLNELYHLAISDQQFFDRYNTMAKDVYMRHSALNPHVKETLEDIRGCKISIALASSSPHSWIEMMLSRFALAQYFSVVASSEDVGFVGKPAPDIYLYTAQKLSVSPKHCVVIEDSRNGVLSAKAAGMIAVGYRTPYNSNQDLSMSDMIINDLAEITHQSNGPSENCHCEERSDEAISYLSQK